MKESLQILTQNWHPRFEELINSSSLIRIISPFVTKDAVELPPHGRRRTIHLITRFNLEDFLSGVSDLSALKHLVESGAKIRGVKGLHSKLYIFDNRSVIVSSANLTRGGLFNNLEFGVYIERKRIVEEAIEYFKRLWGKGAKFSFRKVIRWERKIGEARARRGRRGNLGGQLPDEGASIKQSRILKQIEKRFFVKFDGTDKSRADSNEKVRDILKGGVHHFACTYPKGKRPRQVKHGDIVYMAYITKNPRGIAIYGRAEGIAHKEGRDDATPKDKKRWQFLKWWPHYIRVFHSVFLDGRLSECIRLDDIIRRHESMAFASTARNKKSGSGNTNPNKAIMQQPGVEITPQAAQTLKNLFDRKILKLGTVPDSFIERLDKPEQTVTP